MKFRAAVEQIASRFAALIRGRRPGLSAVEADLLAWSGLAVATSVSYHSLVLPEPEFTTLLGELITTAVDAPIPPPRIAFRQNVQNQHVADPITP